MSRSIAVAISAVLASACVTEDAPHDDAWSQPGKVDDPSAGGVVPTQASGVRLLDGYHALLDAPTQRCLESDEQGPAYAVGAVEKPFELAFIRTKDELARTLGVDAGLTIKYGPASFGPTFSFLHNFKQTSSATHLLVSARASYRVTNTRAVRLTSDASAWLTQDPRTFLHRCGNFFVNGVELEAQLFLMIRLEALTADAARTINGELGASVPAVGIDGNLKARLEQLARREDISVEMHVLDRGFLIDGGTSALIASLLDNGLTADTFNRLDMVRQAMLRSLEADACRDGGAATTPCMGDRPGYAANTARNAITVRVDLRSYSRASNAPLGGPGSPYEAIRDLVDRANRHLRILSRYAWRMDAITRVEIRPFLEASRSRRARYGIAPPAPPVYDLDAMTAIATRFRDRFDPEVYGSTASALHAALARCWSSTLDGAIETCASPETAADLPEVTAAEYALADYFATGRIVRLRFTPKGLHRYGDARDVCAPDATRLPTFAEAERLAIAIGFADLPRTSDEELRFAAWHGDQAMCGSNAGAYRNVPGGTHGNLCTSDNVFSPRPALTLCVPPDGLFGDLAVP